MTLPWYYLAGALALLIGGGALALHVHDDDIRRQAALQDSLRVVRQSEAALKQQDAQAAKVIAHDTVVLVRWQTSYKVLHDTVLKDVHDTITVERFVQVADSTIAACSQLVSDCQARTRILTEQVAAVSAERDLWHKQAPNLLQRHVGFVSSATGVLGFVAGVIAGKHF